MTTSKQTSETIGWTARYSNWGENDFFMTIKFTRAEMWNYVLGQWYKKEEFDTPRKKQNAIKRLKRSSNIEVVKAKMIGVS